MSAEAGVRGDAGVRGEAGVRHGTVSHGLSVYTALLGSETWVSIVYTKTASMLHVLTAYTTLLWSSLGGVRMNHVGLSAYTLLSSGGAYESWGIAYTPLTFRDNLFLLD